MGMFDDFATETKQREGGDYFVPGTYAVKIAASKYKERSRNSGLPVAIFECTVVESDNPALPTGKTAAHVIAQRGGDRGYFYGELLHVVAALSGMHHVEDRAAIDEKVKPIAGALLEKAFTANAFAGLHARIVVTERPTKSGGVFTAHEWLPFRRGESVR